MGPSTVVFGAYTDHDLYQRNRTLSRCLRQLSADYHEVRPSNEHPGHMFSRHTSLWSRLKNCLYDRFLLWRRRRELRQADLVFVPYPAYLDLLLLRCIRLGDKTKVLADAFLELHSTVVEDRGILPRGSFRERCLRGFQRLSLARADLVLIDTEEQSARLDRELQGLRIPVRAVPVGIDEELWPPLSAAKPLVGEPLQVLFYGTFIPLHGVATIIEAARLLARRGVAIEFQLIGDGQEAGRIVMELKQQPVSNITWRRSLVNTTELREALAAAHIVLGVFGESIKAGEVVPYKVHQALASNRPVVSRFGSATDALLDRERGLVLCPPGDPNALADELEGLAERLHGGWRATTREIFDEHFGQASIAARMGEIVEEVLTSP